MTQGIYSLSWNTIDKLYIGQSIDIERRYRDHLSKLRRGVHAKKLQQAFDTYGIPQLTILFEENDPLRLDSLELEAIDLFDSVNTGFNTNTDVSGGCNLTGESAGNACYTNIQIEKQFHLLVDRQDLRALDISQMTGVDKSTIDAIQCFKVHLWLETKFPEKYAILRNKAINTSRFGKGKTLKERGIQYPPIVQPTGTEYIVENTQQFAKDHKLNNAHLVQVLRGKEKQHKGWKLKND